MRILLVCEFFPKSANCEIRGGAEGRTFFLAKYLVKLGHKVFILATQEAGLPKFSQIFGVKVVRTGFERSYSQAGSVLGRLSFVLQATKAVKDLNLDLVDGQNFLGYLAAARIAKFKNIPAIATYNDVWIGEWIKNVGFLAGIFGEIAERFALKRHWVKFIAVSNLVRDKLIKKGVPSQKIVSIKCGIDWEEIKNFGKISQKDTDIICVSRLVKYKRVADLVKAAKKLKSKNHNLRIKIIGTGPEKENLEKLTKELGLTANVKFLGFIEKHIDVLAEIKKSKIFCLTSSVEGFGIVIIESASLGVPYVATNIPAITEVTEQGLGGLLYDVGDINQLVKNLEKLLVDEKLYSAKVTNGVNLAKKYDWVEIAKQTISLYRKVLSRYQLARPD